MIETITSVQNPLIKRIVNLKQKKYRDKENLFIAEGVRLAEDALKSITNIKYCFYTKNSLENKRIMAIIERLKTEPIKLIEVSLSVYEKITETNEPQGIMVILQHNNYNLKEFAKLEKPFLIILDTIQDPGNIGTIIRTAEASGCNGVILTKGCADIYAGKTVRATMGAMLRLPIVTNVSPEELIVFFKENDIELFTTEITNGREYYNEEYNVPLGLVFGNEGNGVNPELSQKIKKKIYIPMIGAGESLNVGVAAGIIMYEVFRQRNCIT